MTTFKDEELIAYLEGHELEESRRKGIEGALVSDTELQKRLSLIKESFDFIENEADKILNQPIPPELKRKSHQLDAPSFFDKILEVLASLGVGNLSPKTNSFALSTYSLVTGAALASLAFIFLPVATNLYNQNEPLLDITYNTEFKVFPLVSVKGEKSEAIKTTISSLLSSGLNRAVIVDGDIEYKVFVRGEFISEDQEVCQMGELINIKLGTQYFISCLSVNGIRKVTLTAND